jgi:hypothetical protein
MSIDANPFGDRKKNAGTVYANRPRDGVENDRWRGYQRTIAPSPYMRPCMMLLGRRNAADTTLVVM